MVNYCLKDLYQDKTKVILIICGLTASFLMVHISFGMVYGTLDEFTRVVDKTDYDAFITQRNKPIIFMGGFISDDIYEEVVSTKGVKHVDKIIDNYAGFEFEGEENGLPVIGFDVESAQIKPWDMVEGDMEDLKKNNTIIVDEIILKNFPNLKIGDKVVGGVFEDKLEVVGISKNDHRTGQAVIWTSFDVAKRLMYMGNESTYLAILFEEGYDMDTLKGIGKTYDDDIRITSDEDMREMIIDFIINDTGIGGSVGILAIIGFFVAMIVLSITLYQSVTQKLEELVTLKAMGASKKTINNILLGQTLLLVTAAFIVSVIIAALMAPYLTISSSLSVSINPGITILNYVISIGLGMFCSIFSIRKVHKTDPAIIFRA